MEIAVGKQYRLINKNTRETAYLTTHELIERQGQRIVYGTLEAHGIWLPRSGGRIHIPAEPCCFPVFPQAKGSDIMKLMDQLKSLPLFLELGEPVHLELLGGQSLKMAPGQYMPVLNVNWPRRLRGKHEMVRRSAQLIQVWQEWQELGQVVPIWFRELLREETHPSQLIA